MGTVITAEQLESRLAPYRGQSTLVSTNGCFDILHVGHLRYLQAARAFGDLLIVAVNSDYSVRCLKGAERPIVPEADRAELLAGLNCVDFVVLFDDPTPEALLRQIRPNIHVKGGQYTTETLPEAALLKELGAEIRFVEMVESKSSTNIIEKIKQLKTL